MPLQLRNVDDPSNCAMHERADQRGGALLGTVAIDQAVHGNALAPPLGEHQLRIVVAPRVEGRGQGTQGPWRHLQGQRAIHFQAGVEPMR